MRNMRKALNFALLLIRRTLQGEIDRIIESVLMMFANRIGESLETSLPSCRNRGRMRGRVGALCLSSSECDPFPLRNPTESYDNKDKHKAPTLPLITPCPYRIG